MLRESPTDRGARLAQVPDNLRDLVSSRLDNGTRCRRHPGRNFWTTSARCNTSRHVDPTNAPPEPGLRADRTMPIRRAGRRCLRMNARKSPRFDQFFELTPDEKQKRSTRCPAPSAPRWKRHCNRSTSCRRHNGPVHPCVHGICRHDAGGARGIFEKRRALVAIVANERQAWRDLVAQVPCGHRCQPRSSCRRCRQKIRRTLIRLVATNQN